jgi:hypothetical protein
MERGRDPADTSAVARLRRALATHGTRGLPFAAARRALNGLEDRFNPSHVNHFDFGYSDVHPQTWDPVQALHSVEFRTLVIEMPLAALRWSRVGLPLDRANPFVRTVADHHAGTVRSYAPSALRRHFAEWQPASCAEVLGLDPAGPTGREPPQAVALPWSAEAGLDLATRLDRVDRFNRAESRATGAELGVDAGHKHFGPVSDELGRLEYERYAALTEAVATHGYRPRVAEGYVGVQVLVDGDRRVGLITGPGLHRAIVAAGLDVDPLAVAVDKRPSMIHRGDVASWPGVRAGLFDEAAAIAVFDRIVTGRPPDGFPVPEL